MINVCGIAHIAPPLFHSELAPMCGNVQTNHRHTGIEALGAGGLHPRTRAAFPHSRGGRFHVCFIGELVRYRTDTL